MVSEKNNVTYYNRIILKYSTCFQLPDDLKNKYSGSGGKDTGAAVRIQFEYDILSGNIVQFSIDAFNHQDASDAMETIESLKPGDLVIRDLGYMHKKVLQQISNREAAYVTRLDPRINAFEKNANGEFVKIEFSSLRAKMKREGTAVIEKTVYLGADRSHKTRLIVYLLPEEVEQQYLRKINRVRKRNGSAEASKESKVRSQLAFMITTESTARLAAPNVYTLNFPRGETMN